MLALIAIKVDDNKVISIDSDLKPNLSKSKSQRFNSNFLSFDASNILSLDIKFIKRVFGHC